ncbi:MAG: hypothetical protein ACLP8A_00095 [Methylovirgula sp.]
MTPYMMQLGIDYALIKRKGLNTEKVEMNRALTIALQNFEAAFSSWIEAKDVFPDCHPNMGNAPSNREMAEIAAGIALSSEIYLPVKRGLRLAT